MSSFVLQLVQLDGVPRDHMFFGEDIEAAVEKMELLQLQAGPSRSSGCLWQVVDVDDPEAGPWDRDRMNELGVPA
jgi:hypothetical protein